MITRYVSPVWHGKSSDRISTSVATCIAVREDFHPLIESVLTRPGPFIGRVVGLASFRYLWEAVLVEVAFGCRHFNGFWYVALKDHISRHAHSERRMWSVMGSLSAIAIPLSSALPPYQTMIAAYWLIEAWTWVFFTINTSLTASIMVKIMYASNLSPFLSLPLSSSLTPCSL
jgi:hypothetical protein